MDNSGISMTVHIQCSWYHDSRSGTEEVKPFCYLKYLLQLSKSYGKRWPDNQRETGLKNEELAASPFSSSTRWATCMRSMHVFKHSLRRPDNVHAYRYYKLLCAGVEPSLRKGIVSELFTSVNSVAVFVIYLCMRKPN